MNNINMSNKDSNIKCEYTNIKKIVESLPIFKSRFAESVCLKYNYRRIIYKVYDTMNDCYATAKFIIKHNIDEESLTLIDFLRNNNHKNLAEIYELGTIGNFYVIFIKYIEGLRFNDFICGNNDCTIVRSVISGLVDGLYFLHSNNILHSDIKPSNIIVDSDNVAKIIDFDMLMKINSQYIVSNIIVGTYPYIPNEIMTKKTYYLKSDIWGLGVTIIRSLFEWKRQEYQKDVYINDGDNTNLINYEDVDLSFAITHKIDNNISALIRKMVLNDVSDRVSAVEAVTMLKTL
jgi:serine/threonine protein kinase